MNRISISIFEFWKCFYIPLTYFRVLLISINWCQRFNFPLTKYLPCHVCDILLQDVVLGAGDSAACFCGVDWQDGPMLQCFVCKKTSHGICYKIILTDQPIPQVNSYHSLIAPPHTPLLFFALALNLTVLPQNFLIVKRK